MGECGAWPPCVAVAPPSAAGRCRDCLLALLLRYCGQLPGPVLAGTFACTQPNTHQHTPTHTHQHTHTHTHAHAHTHTVVQWAYEQGRTAAPADFKVGAGLYAPANCSTEAFRFMYDPPKDGGYSWGCYDKRMDSTVRQQRCRLRRLVMCVCMRVHVRVCDRGAGSRSDRHTCLQRARTGSTQRASAHATACGHRTSFHMVTKTTGVRWRCTTAAASPTAPSTSWPLALAPPATQACPQQSVRAPMRM